MPLVLFLALPSRPFLGFLALTLVPLVGFPALTLMALCSLSIGLQLSSSSTRVAPPRSAYGARRPVTTVRNPAARNPRYHLSCPTNSGVAVSI